MTLLARLRAFSRSLLRDVRIVYCAARDSRTPYLLRALALIIALYALSPIDLIPDFIPVLGYLDDLIIVPLGIWLVIRLLPVAVLACAREQAFQSDASRGGFLAGSLVVGTWIVGAILLVYWIG